MKQTANTTKESLRQATENTLKTEHLKKFQAVWVLRVIQFVSEAHGDSEGHFERWLGHAGILRVVLNLSCDF